LRTRVKKPIHDEQCVLVLYVLNRI